MSLGSWRHTVLWASLAVPLLVLFVVAPIGQPADYHGFADARTIVGIPNGFDVMSNAPFLVFGVWGSWRARALEDRAAPWLVLYVGVAFAFFGSSYYHLAPDDARLAWDRLPMTLGFVGLFVALLSEHVDGRVRAALWPAVILGVLSVVYWRTSGDLGPYLYVQLAPLLAVAVVLILFPIPRAPARALWGALGLYGAAKGAEALDHQIFAALGETLSGHSIKHLLAGAGVGVLMGAMREASLGATVANPDA